MKKNASVLVFLLGLCAIGSCFTLFSTLDPDYWPNRQGKQMRRGGNNRRTEPDRRGISVRTGRMGGKMDGRCSTERSGLQERIEQKLNMTHFHETLLTAVKNSQDLTHFPVEISHNFIVLSAAPDMRYFVWATTWLILLSVLCVDSKYSDVGSIPLSSPFFCDFSLPGKTVYPKQIDCLSDVLSFPARSLSSSRAHDDP